MDHGTVRVGGDTLHYIESDGRDATGTDGSGDDPPLVCLHGAVIDAAHVSWGGVLDELATTLGRRVLALDQLGYGESDRPEDAAYSTAAHVERFGGFVDALSLDRVVPVGLSMGGGVALGYALDHPDRVERLVLVDSHGLGAPVPGGKLTYLLSRTDVPNKAALALLSRSKGITRASLGNVVVDPGELDDAVVAEVYDLLQRPDPGFAFRRWRRHEVTWGGYRTDYTNRLAGFEVPTLLVHGAADEVVPVSVARQAAARLPEGTLEVFEDCAHWPPRERPSVFVSRLRTWWA
ncbi:alpha/beta fold hydrolase [Halomarina litorea]|uniref:alpha/beta fold hydrolase n=1 Tax=Halomarina litorea TaxID=2961595 RepID=UPI0020C24786|nr:alpha/beta hydrolase [Halomarina sp. BCD28]